MEETNLSNELDWARCGVHDATLTHVRTSLLKLSTNEQHAKYQESFLQLVPSLVKVVHLYLHWKALEPSPSQIATLSALEGHLKSLNDFAYQADNLKDALKAGAEIVERETNSTEPLLLHQWLTMAPQVTSMLELLSYVRQNHEPGRPEQGAKKSAARCVALLFKASKIPHTKLYQQTTAALFECCGEKPGTAHKTALLALQEEQWTVPISIQWIDEYEAALR